MTELALLLLVVTVTGIYAVRWTRRLAPAGSELPVKTLAATVLAALVVASELTPLRAGPVLRWVAAVAGPLYVFAPLLITSVARAGRYRVATVLTDLLYWSPSGRHGLRRLTTQIALRKGDADAALRMVPPDAPVLQAQLHALRQEWDEVLAIEAPEDGDNAWLAAGARVEALLALERSEEAASQVERLRDRAARVESGPILKRVAQMATVRLAAARGRLAEAQEALQPPPAGVAPHELFALLATAAERGGHAAAGDLWTRAYLVAPPALRPRFEARIRAAGREVPKVTARRPLGTWILAAVLGAAYLVQMGLDRFGTAILTPLGRLDAGTGAAAFLLNVPGVPQGDAWWRFLSYAFVHGNLIHIAMNLWVLVDIGRLYEARRGWGDLLAAFTLGTGMGAYLTLIAQAGDQLVLVGASGGVLGVAGALLADVLRSRSSADRLLTRSLVQWMALIGLLSVAVPMVSLWGHAGGIVGGLLWGFARQGLPREPRVGTWAGAAAIAALTVAAAAAGVVAVGQLL